MIAVISDLHFEEEASDVIRGADGRTALIFRRNLHPKAYISFIAMMAEQLQRRRVRSFDLVLAGDIFDFNRTVLWFDDELRPYVAVGEVTPALEAKLLKILNATIAEPAVRETLECFRLLAQGRYRVPSKDGDSMEEVDFPADRIAIHYIPGNHDRMANATPAVRGRVRELFGLHGDAAFDHTVQFEDPSVLVRHGQEYDADNFALDLSRRDTIPLELPDQTYGQSTFGDFVTIDVAVRLPHLLRKKYGASQILQNKVLSSLYLRLLQFDDVRPQSALLDYLLDTSGFELAEEQVWEALAPLIDTLLDEIHDNKYFRQWLRERAHAWTPILLEISRGLLKLGAWRTRFARNLARRLSRHFLSGGSERPEFMAQREEAIRRGAVRLVLAGHTHSPHVSLVASDQRGDRFYINTGTWRNRIPTTPDARTFGRIKALTYVMLFASHEDPETAALPLGSFDYWSGFTRHWAVAEEE